MKIIVFEQWDKLTALMRNLAAGSAEEKAQYAISRVQPTGGKAQLADRTMNVLAVVGGETEIAVPDIIPGKARDFLLRVTASGENTLRFTGAEAFEGEAGALDPPADGETVVYFFTETDADVLLVARMVAARIETEGES